MKRITKPTTNDNVNVFQVCKELNLKLTPDQYNYLGYLARQAWNLISTVTPIKVKCKAGFRVNTFPVEFKPVIVNCVRMLLKEEADKHKT